MMSVRSRTRRPYQLIALFTAIIWMPILPTAFSHALQVKHTEMHIVARGESLWSIAARYAGHDTDVDTVLDRIVAVNGLGDNGIAPGQQIRIPVKLQGG